MVNFFINKKAAVFSFSILIAIVGIMAYISLPKESFPEIKQPMIFITTTYVGVSAKDMENLVTRVLEEEIDGLEGLDKMSSSSKQSISSIFVEFTSDVSLEIAQRRIRDRVDLAKPKLPADADEPIITELSSSNFPIFTMVLSHPDGLAVIDKAAELVEEELGRVHGVLDVRVAGRLEKEVAIEIDPGKLEKYGFSLNDIISAVQSENVTIPGGILESEVKNYSLAVTGEIKDPKQFEDIIIRANGVSIPLRELGTAEFDWKEPETYSRLNGSPCISISITKRTGENIIELVDRIKKVVDQIKPSFPIKTQIDISSDDSKNVKEILLDLENNVFTALVLVLLVTLIFIGRVNALFVSIAIPLSIFMSMYIIQIFDITLNMIVLFSLILALGMLVDNGIVIVENIYRHASLGKSRIQAAIDGAQEVAWPIIASTVTTCLAFFPIIFMPGIMGDIMAFLPKTVIIVLMSSLFIALTTTPVFCATFLSISEENIKKINEGSGLFKKFQNIYGKLVKWAVNNPVYIVILCIIVAFSGFIVYGKFGKEPIFFPYFDPSVGLVSIETQQGTPLDVTDKITKEIEAVIPNSPASLDNYLVTSGRGGADEIFGGGGSEHHKAAIQIKYKSFLERKIKGQAAVDSLKNRLKNFIGADIVVKEREEGPPAGNDISIQVVGDDYAVLGVLTDSILNILRKYPELKVFDHDYESAKPEISVSIDRKKAAFYGLSTREIASSIRNSIHGAIIGKFRQGKDEYDINIRYKDNFRNTLNNLENIQVVNRDDERIPLSSVATIRSRSSTGVIKRNDLKRSVEIWADFKKGIQTKKIITDTINKQIEEINVPPNYRIQEGEGFEIRKESTEFLIQSFFVAAFLIIIVLIVQFNSITQPFIMMITVLFSFSGVFWGYWLINLNFIIIMSGIGCLSLMGVVVNNCIVLIDYTNLLLKKGKSYKEAIIIACKTRLRPVLLTAITTVLGMFPMAIGISFDIHKFTWQFGSESGQYWIAFAWAMIFGLSFATTMTLVLVPSLLSINYRLFKPKSV
ncbi:MAG: efflux RND transporter permease subunit [Chitinispirillia bacterium]|jgi:multidrug efflux pump subunit AcrB